MRDIDIFVVHTEERQSFLCNTKTVEEAYELVEEYGCTPIGYDNVFIPANELKSVENICS